MLSYCRFSSKSFWSNVYLKPHILIPLYQRHSILKTKTSLPFSSEIVSTGKILYANQHLNESSEHVFQQLRGMDVPRRVVRQHASDQEEISAEVLPRVALRRDGRCELEESFLEEITSRKLIPFAFHLDYHG